MDDYMSIAPLYNGAVVVDCDTVHWGDPKTDQSVYNFALIKRDLNSVEKRPNEHVNVQLPQSSIVFVRPGDIEQMYGGHRGGGGRIALSALVFKDKLIKQVFDDPHLDGRRDIRDPIATKLLEAAVHLRSDTDPLLVDHVTMALLHRIRGLRPPVEIKSKGRIERALLFINERLDQKITLGDLAGAAAMSSFHFVRTFRQVTGMTPLAYVTAKRIDRAKALMAKTNHGMAEIALMCGFSSQSHFSAAFKSATGQTPRQHYMMARGGKTTNIVETSPDRMTDIFRSYT